MQSRSIFVIIFVNLYCIFIDDKKNFLTMAPSDNTMLTKPAPNKQCFKTYNHKYSFHSNFNFLIAINAATTSENKNTHCLIKYCFSYTQRGNTKVISYTSRNDNNNKPIPTTSELKNIVINKQKTISVIESCLSIHESTFGCMEIYNVTFYYVCIKRILFYSTWNTPEKSQIIPKHLCVLQSKHLGV